LEGQSSKYRQQYFVGHSDLTASQYYFLFVPPSPLAANYLSRQKKKKKKKKQACQDASFGARLPPLTNKVLGWTRRSLDAILLLAPYPALR
jgi:hypothetical protein